MMLTVRGGGHQPLWEIVRKVVQYGRVNRQIAHRDGPTREDQLQKGGHAENGPKQDRQHVRVGILGHGHRVGRGGDHDVVVWGENNTIKVLHINILLNE